MAEEEEYTSAALNARELEWAINSPELIAEHKKINGPIIRTRFPPEPNGYLHVGHAKSMNMNFRLAFEKLKVPMENRRTIFRYDDTNPEAESAEYIDSLRRDVEWLGWKPEHTTYSSDNFQHIYDSAIVLIKKGLAYVCDMTKEEMVTQRDLAMKRVSARSAGKDPDEVAPIPSADILPGRNRDTSVERNLEMFEKMKLGMFEEGQYTLRLKMDFETSNPNMYDLVAYRIKYTPHPHAGKGWCIYPSYDFTHGTCDSLEHIDYSICTLEFETRRECYYWILWALDLYRPKVYEMSRLNLESTVLSKRRLIKLVTTKRVRGWDDPRMPTISGLRRRGYSADIINSFCMEVGATRAANVVEMSRLQQVARLKLAPVATRIMAALIPIRVVISNFTEPETLQVQNIATDESQGSHTITLTSVIFIDASDFRMEDHPDYRGLAPSKAVGLKYHGGSLICDEVSKKEDGTIEELKCHLDMSEGREKPLSHISWTPENSFTAEIRVYNNLFSVAEPSDLWEDELNPNSEIVYANAKMDPSIKDLVDGAKVDKWVSGTALQIERFGYFVVDYETTFNPASGDGKIVLNRTVSLKEEVFKKQVTAEEQAAIAGRAAKTKNALVAKEARMKIDPINFFREAEEFQGKFSQFDAETGIPTHDIDGTALTKSAIKKLTKEKLKHVNQQEKWNSSKISEKHWMVHILAVQIDIGCRRNLQDTQYLNRFAQSVMRGNKTRTPCQRTISKDDSKNMACLSDLWNSLKERSRTRGLDSDCGDENPDLPPWFLRLLLTGNSATSSSFKESIPHIRQEFDWDCGIVCLQMALSFCVSKPESWSSLETRNWLESSIGTRSTWTIDLVSILDGLLKDRDQLNFVAFDYLFYTRHLSVNAALATMGFYSTSFTEDSARIMRKYNGLKVHSEHRMLEHDDLSLEVVLTCLRYDNCLVILLVDNTIFQAMINDTNEKQATHSPFMGHYILLVRRIGNDQVLVLDPGRPTPIIVQTKALESSWNVPGTDSDAIFIVRYGGSASANLASR